jgi:hypothetical protein
VELQNVTAWAAIFTTCKYVKHAFGIFHG